MRVSKEQFAAMQARAVKPKYGNRKKTVGGRVFESASEAVRYQELLLLQHNGEIADLKCQVKIRCDANGVHICNYFADFFYYDRAKKALIYEDRKGARTAVYMLKKRIVRALTGIEIFET